MADGADTAAVLDVAGMDALIATLASDGWDVRGPVVRDGAIVVGPVSGVADLPRGMADEQQPGRYRVRPRDDDLFFGYANAATSFKPVLFPARQLLWSGARRADGFDLERPERHARPLALIGVRGCDLAGIRVQDRVLMERWEGRPAVDVDYADARAGSFIIAVACGHPASTCFCTSTGTGPAPGEGHDLSLTEVRDERGHRFVVTVGSDRGRDVLARVEARAAETDDRQAAEAVVARAAASIERTLECGPLPRTLDDNVEHPLWEDVATRCLACGNCTAVCPTCFCTAVEDVTDLSGDHAQRWRVWDSCFTAGFSYVHGGPVRASTASRYRQWMSHKLGTWTAQFDTLGCVGCGRCIAWCPVGIDITAEAAALQHTTRRPESHRVEGTGSP